MQINSKIILRTLSVVLTVGSVAIGLIIWKLKYVPAYGGDFELTYRAQPWKFLDDTKKLNLLYFGYVKCPDVCPLTLSYAGGAFRKLTPEQLDKIRLIFVSVDQENDDPVAVADYATNFFSSFIGLSGSLSQIDKAIGLYPASYMVEKNEKSYIGYSIIHTDKIFFLNNKGTVQDFVASPRDSEIVLQKIKELL